MASLPLFTSSPISSNVASLRESAPGSNSASSAAAARYAPNRTLYTPSVTTIATADPASSPSTATPLVLPSGSYTEARRFSIPPPPRAREVPKPAAYYAPRYHGSPTAAGNAAAILSRRALSLDTSIPPLFATYHHHHSRSYQGGDDGSDHGTTITPPPPPPPPLFAEESGATDIAMPAHDLSHPLGYAQDATASFSESVLLPAPPSPPPAPPSSATSAFSPSSFSPSQNLLGTITAAAAAAGGHQRRKSRGDTGILDGMGEDNVMMMKEDEEEVEEGILGRGAWIWDTAVGWARTVAAVGEKVLDGEERVWKRIIH